MANKQLNELTSISGVVGDDLIPVFDTSETGDEKLKKYTVQELKTDLTSMDPSAFGNWVPFMEKTFNNQPISGTTFLHEDGVKYKFVMDGVFDAAAYIQLSLGGITSGWNSVVGFSDNGYGGAPTANNKIYGEWILSPVNGGLQKQLSGKLSRLGTSIEHINAYNSSTATPTSVNLFEYRGAVNNFTGTYKVYKWQEVKPIELHSYELVKEYNLNNEVLDDTVDWDGETDPDIFITAQMTTGSIKLLLNDSTSNYQTARLYTTNGSSMTLLRDVGDAMYVGAGGRLQKSNGCLSGDPRMCVTICDPNGATGFLFYEWQGAGPVTSVTMNSDGSVATGNISVYKLTKTHLFNQTIYNDLTLNVATTGSDTTGTGTSQKPFASINGALGWCRNKTINDDVGITISVADGTYTSQQFINYRNISSKITIKGNTTAPSNVVLNFAAGQSGFSNSKHSHLVVQGLRVVGADKGEWKIGISSQWGSTISIYKCEFDNWGIGIQTYYNAYIYVSDGIVNNCNYGCQAVQHGGLTVKDSSVTNNTSAGLVAEQKGAVIYNGVTLSGNTADVYTATLGTIQSY